MTPATRERLTGATGQPVATFLRGDRDGFPLADDVQPAGGATAEQIADAIERELPGHIIGAPRELGELLVRRGAVARRRSTLMECDPAAARAPMPAPPSGVTIEPAAGRTPDDLLDAYVNAYPEAHPDHHTGLDRDGQRELLRALMAGEVIGPLLGCSRVARTQDGYCRRRAGLRPGGRAAARRSMGRRALPASGSPERRRRGAARSDARSGPRRRPARRRAARQRREPGARALRPARLPPAPGGRHGARSGSGVSAADGTQPRRPASVTTRDHSPERRSTRTG